jgi:pimeloyl-ACP methyl ester carboxylesterase
MLETITRPTLLITGDANLYAPPPVQRLLADRITHAETLIIAEVGHAAYWEQPDIVNRAVLVSIQRVDRHARSKAPWQKPFRTPLCTGLA